MTLAIEAPAEEPVDPRKFDAGTPERWGDDSHTQPETERGLALRARIGRLASTGYLDSVSPSRRLQRQRTKDIDEAKMQARYACEAIKGIDGKGDDSYQAALATVTTYRTYALLATEKRWADEDIEPHKHAAMHEMLATRQKHTLDPLRETSTTYTPPEFDESRAVEVTNPTNVKHLKELLLSTLKAGGLNEDKRGMFVNSSGVNGDVNPAAVAKYFGIEAHEWNAQRYGKKGAVPESVMDHVNYLIKLPDYILDEFIQLDETPQNSARMIEWIGAAHESESSTERLLVDRKELVPAIEQIDELHRQLELLEDQESDTAKSIKAAIQKRHGSLEARGLRRLATQVGETYNPKFHEPVATERTKGDVQPTISRIKGSCYLSQDGVIRRAQVVVSGNPKDADSREPRQRKPERQQPSRPENTRQAERAQQTRASNGGRDNNHESSSSASAPPKPENHSSATTPDQKRLARYNEQITRIEALKNDPTYGHLVSDSEALKLLHKEIQEEVWPQYEARLEKLNKQIEKANKACSEDDKLPLIESVEKMPAKEKRPIINPIDRKHTDNFVRARLPEDTKLPEDVRSTITLARLLTVGKLRPPKPPTKK